MISVVVPVYNVEKYLDRCVTSLLQQKYDGKYEIILVDDGSPDGCGRICDEYAERHSIVRTFHKKNGGLSSARNYGVLKAEGNWITFVDSDDYVSETYLFDLKQLVTRFNADMAITNVTLMSNEEAMKIHEDRFCPFVLNNKNAFLETYVNNRVGWSACGKLIKTDVVKKNPFPEGYYEEMASSYLFIIESPYVAFGDYVDNYHYLRREGSITASELNEKHFRVFDVCKEIDEFVRREFVDKEYVAVLMYQKGVLQLLNRTILTNKQFNDLFYMYRRLFRESVMVLLRKKDIPLKSKYYAIILSMSPNIYRLHRKIFNIWKGKA